MADQPRRPRTLNDARTEAEAAFKRTTTKVVDAPPKTTALPGVKELVSLRIDQDVLEYFREDGPGWIRTTAAGALTATAAAASSATTTARAATGRLRFVIVAGTRGRRGCHDLGQQGLVLQLVEVAALGVAAGGLPARDHGAGG